MINDIKNGTVNVIVALKLDRLTRSVFDVEKLMKLLDIYGCDLDCKDDDSNTLTSNGRMYIRLTTAFSQNEIERCSERTKFGMVGAIKAGHVPCIKWHQLIFIVFTVVFRGNSKLVLFPRF